MNAFVRKPTPVNATPMSEETFREIERGILWCVSTDYMCKTCGAKAFLEKKGDRRLACQDCGFVSFYPDLHFDPV